MKTPQWELDARVREAVQAVANGVGVPADPVVLPAQDARHGDYQCNLAMTLARGLKTNPRALAVSIVEKLQVSDMCLPPEIAGPGFINLRLTPEWINRRMNAIAGDARLGVSPVEKPMTVVVDYSSPNMAKEMHVGHIRSTVIGDACTRLLRFAGHQVIADNHVGDWGTQFGQMIVAYHEWADPQALQQNMVVELERVYKVFNEKAKNEPGWADKARAELAKLQAGDPDNTDLWKRFLAASRAANKEVYGRLGVTFDVWHGESFYNPMLADTVQALLDAGIAREDQGAVVIFFEDDKELADKPLIIRKRDGAYPYATSDLAAIRYRENTWHADEMLYFVDGRQQLHFKQVFEAARRWGYREVRLIHAWFGTILGPGGTPIKTREGGDVKLRDLLDEAETRALAIVREKNPSLSDEQMREVARVVGIGAVKYADMAQNRTSDYQFGWDKMLALDGNTAAYSQYAYARQQSIFRKGDVKPETLQGEMRLSEEAELALARHILRFGEAVASALDGYKPNVMTGYLFELSSSCSVFLEKCPVLKSEEPTRTSRLLLCRTAADAIKLGLGLLGIETLPQM
ncbi:MAG: arginine--tRNA ligase [Candidatus Xenobia bacterium]